MEQKKGAGRIAKWDNARWILITLVVICHFFENYLGNPVANSLFFYVYTFHMPAFFLIAGLFSKKTVEDRRIDKVAPYILIYIFIKIVNWIVQMIIYGKYTSINWFVESGVAWFALAMFFMYIITFYTKRFKPVYGFVLSVVIAMILGYTVENTDIFCWMRIVNFYPFFYLGYVISIEDITKWLENKKIKVMAIISLITYFVICCVGIDKIFWLRFLLTGRSGYYRLEYGMAYVPDRIRRGGMPPRGSVHPCLCRYRTGQSCRSQCPSTHSFRLGSPCRRTHSHRFLQGPSAPRTGGRFCNSS